MDRTPVFSVAQPAPAAPAAEWSATQRRTAVGHRVVSARVDDTQIVPAGHPRSTPQPARHPRPGQYRLRGATLAGPEHRTPRLVRSWSVATWISVLGGLGAIAAALVAVFAIARQEMASRRALDAQTLATRQVLEHERQLAMEERLWNRRADLYARIAQIMRQHSESSVETPCCHRVSAPPAE